MPGPTGGHCWNELVSSPTRHPRAALTGPNPHGENVRLAYMDPRIDRRPELHPFAAVERVGGRLMIATPDDQLVSFQAEHSDEPGEVGERIVELCDGRRTIRDISVALSAEFDVDCETALHDTLQLVQQLVESKVLVLADS